MPVKYMKGGGFEFPADWGFKGSSTGDVNPRDHPNGTTDDEFGDNTYLSRTMKRGGRVVYAKGGSAKKNLGDMVNGAPGPAPVGPPPAGALNRATAMGKSALRGAPPAPLAREAPTPVAPMAKGGHLTMKARNALPSSDFALPGKGAGPTGKGSGSYPIPDKNHARAALSRASANASPAQQARIRAKVHAKFPGIGEK